MKSKKLPTLSDSDKLDRLEQKLINEPISLTQAKNILKIVNKGLTCGIGEPIPGRMCVEAAVCFALGLPHSDDPPCVDAEINELKIGLNDLGWSDNKTRAKGLKSLSIAQLGTNKKSFKFKKFEKYLVVNSVKYLAAEIFGLIAEEWKISPHGKTYELLAGEMRKAKTIKQIMSIMAKEKDMDIRYSSSFSMALNEVEKGIEDNNMVSLEYINSALNQLDGSTKSEVTDKIYSGYAEIFVEALGAGNAEGYALMKKLIK